MRAARFGGRHNKNGHFTASVKWPFFHDTAGIAGGQRQDQSCSSDGVVGIGTFGGTQRSAAEMPSF